MNDLPSTLVSLAAEQALRVTRAALRNTLIDPGEKPATLLVCPSGLGSLPEVYYGGLDSFVDNVVRWVNRAALGRYDEGNPHEAIQGMALLRGRPATRWEIAPLKIAMLSSVASMWHDLRQAVRVTAAMQRGYVRSFGAVAVKLVDPDGDRHSLDVACTGWDPDADRLAALQLQVELDRQLILAARLSGEQPPRIDSPTFVLDQRPPDGWKLMHG